MSVVRHLVAWPYWDTESPPPDITKSRGVWLSFCSWEATEPYPAGDVTTNPNEATCEKCLREFTAEAIAPDIITAPVDDEDPP